MRVLLDACIDVRIRALLERRGHRVETLPLEPGIPDDRVLRLARKLKCVLVTADKDFGEPVFARGLASPGVVRLVDLPLAAQGAAMLAALEEYEAELLNGAFVVVEEDRVRVRRR